MPVLIPVEQVGVLPEALRKMLLLEPVQDSGINQVGLPDELWRGKDAILFLPMDRNLRLVVPGGSRSIGMTPASLV